MVSIKTSDLLTKNRIRNLFIFLMQSVATATITILLKLQSIWSCFLVFRCYVVTFFTFNTLQNYVVTRHNIKPLFLYSIISETVPAPTVLPPSLIANLNPFSIAIGAINSIFISMLSPGITISTPSGRSATPVMSVVLK